MVDSELPQREAITRGMIDASGSMAWQDQPHQIAYEMFPGPDNTKRAAVAVVIAGCMLSALSHNPSALDDHVVYPQIVDDWFLEQVRSSVENIVNREVENG